MACFKKGLAISNCSSLDLNISSSNLTHPLLQVPSTHCIVNVMIKKKDKAEDTDSTKVQTFLIQVTVDSIDYLTVRGLEVRSIFISTPLLLTIHHGDITITT